MVETTTLIESLAFVMATKFENNVGLVNVFISELKTLELPSINWAQRY